MKHWYVIFFILFLFAKCSSAQTYFPNTLPVKNNQTSERIKGSRLFLVIPANYKIQSKSIGYHQFKKDSTTGFHIYEGFHDNFYSMTSGFFKSSFVLKNSDTGTCKKIKVGSFDGIYYSGIWNMPASEQKTTFLMFGDSSFSATISGYFQPADKVAEVEINSILRTAGYDTSVIPDPLELENYKFDLGITGFKNFTSGYINRLSYSRDGALNAMVESGNISSFYLEKNKCANIDRAKEFVKLKIEKLTEFNLIKLTNVQRRNILISGNPAYEVIMDGQGKYMANTKYYIVVIQKENMALLFLGVDRDKGKWLEKFKLTVQSIKFE